MVFFVGVQDEKTYKTAKQKIIKFVDLPEDERPPTTDDWRTTDEGSPMTDDWRLVVVLRIRWPVGGLLPATCFFEFGAFCIIS